MYLLAISSDPIQQSSHSRRFISRPYEGMLWYVYSIPTAMDMSTLSAGSHQNGQILMTIFLYPHIDKPSAQNILFQQWWTIYKSLLKVSTYEMFSTCKYWCVIARRIEYWSHVTGIDNHEAAQEWINRGQYSYHMRCDRSISNTSCVLFVSYILLF